MAIVQRSSHVRHGIGLWTGEFAATFALLAVIWSARKHHPALMPFAVAASIGSAYWFTSSTSFANPAVTLARAFSNTFAGIRPDDVPAFVVAQILGAMSATLLAAWFDSDRAVPAE